MALRETNWEESTSVARALLRREGGGGARGPPLSLAGLSPRPPSSPSSLFVPVTVTRPYQPQRTGKEQTENGGGLKRQKKQKTKKKTSPMWCPVPSLPSRLATRFCVKNWRAATGYCITALRQRRRKRGCSASRSADSGSPRLCLLLRSTAAARARAKTLLEALLETLLEAGGSSR